MGERDHQKGESNGRVSQSCNETIPPQVRVVHSPLVFKRIVGRSGRVASTDVYESSGCVDVVFQDTAFKDFFLRLPVDALLLNCPVD